MGIACLGIVYNRLVEPRAPSPALLRQTAEELVAVYEKELGVRLSFDRAGVEWVDAHIERLRLDLPIERIPGVVDALGAFVGECMVRCYGGHWVEHSGHWGVELNGVIAFPMSKVQKQFEDGTPESVAVFFREAPRIPGHLKTFRSPEEDASSARRRKRAWHFAYGVGSFVLAFSVILCVPAVPKIVAGALVLAGLRAFYVALRGG